MSRDDNDLEWLYEQSRKIGKRPTEEQEELFLELVGKWDSDNKPIDEARRWALKELYDRP